MNIEEINKKEEIVRQLEKVKIFHGQTVLIKILYYLIEAEKKGENPKSSTIAIDVLSDGKDMQIALDSQVRTYIHSLRKKLELFYLSEGKNERHKISIPKGQYKIQLESSAALSPSIEKTKKKGILLYSGLFLLISVAINLYLFFFYQNTQSKKELPSLFSSIASSDIPTQIVVGDKVMYREYDPTMDRVRYICDNNLDLNNSRLFTNVINKYSERKIKLSTSTHADIKMYRFAESIRQNYSFAKQPYEVRLSSELEEVNTNILFFGRFGKFDLNILSGYFDKSSFDQRFGHPSEPIGKLVKTGDLKQEAYQRQLVREKRGTFLYVVKTKFEGVEMLFFLHDSSISKDYMYKKILTDAFSNEVTKSFDGTIPAQYELLIEVEGRHIGTSHQVIYAKELN